MYGKLDICRNMNFMNDVYNIKMLLLKDYEVYLFLIRVII